MPHTKAGKAFTELILETFQFKGRLLAAGDRLTKPLGLTSARWQVLGAVEAQSLSVAQIGRRMGLARQNVQRLADALEEEGTVEYTFNPDHKRAKLVRPTGRGRINIKKLGLLQEQRANRTTAGLTASEIEAAINVVRKLRARLEEGQTPP
ncbi:MAG: MarR family transcriptional regulator [Bryobacterales bacterium]|nr:MarR family transcriptional regulator [Bryobacterales bacterium]